MRSPLLSLMVVVMLTSSLAAQTEGWRRYRNADGNFSILMPAQPEDTVSGGGAHTIHAQAGGAVYAAIYVFSEAEQTVDEPTFNIYRDGFMKSLPNCELAAEGPPLPPIPGHVGHSYRMNCQDSAGKKSFVGNLYWGKHYAYAIMVMFMSGPSDPPDVRKFLDSFSVIDAEK